MKTVRYTIKTAQSAQAITKSLITRNGFSAPSFLHEHQINFHAQAKGKSIHAIALTLDLTNEQVRLDFKYKTMKTNYLKIILSFFLFVFLIGFGTQMIVDAPQIFMQVFGFFSIPLLLVYFLGFRKVNSFTQALLNRELTYWLKVLDGELMGEEMITTSQKNTSYTTLQTHQQTDQDLVPMTLQS